jgi:hypothetical protein
MNITARTKQRGRGKGRDFWGIRKWLSAKRVEQENGTMRAPSMSWIARKAATDPSKARQTLMGVRNHRRVLKVLEDMGCPPRLLYGAAAVREPSSVTDGDSIDTCNDSQQAA